VDIVRVVIGGIGTWNGAAARAQAVLDVRVTRLMVVLVPVEVGAGESKVVIGQ